LLELTLEKYDICNSIVVVNGLDDDQEITTFDADTIKTLIYFS